MRRTLDIVFTRFPKTFSSNSGKNDSCCICQTLCSSKLSNGHKESNSDRRAEKQFKTPNGILLKIQKQIIFWNRKVLPHKAPLETQKSFLTTLPENFVKRSSLLAQNPQKISENDFSWRKKYRVFSSVQVGNFESTGKSFSSKVPETIDQITKANTFLSTKNLTSSKTPLKKWQAFVTTRQTDFHKNTGNFCSGRRISLKLNVSRRNCFSSESALGEKKCSFLKPDETIPDELGSLLPEVSNLYFLKLRKK